MNEQQFAQEPDRHEYPLDPPDIEETIKRQEKRLAEIQQAAARSEQGHPTNPEDRPVWEEHSL